MIEDWKQHYQRWLTFTSLNTDLRMQLIHLDERLLEDCFYKNIEFGTGGMRGELGPGINRINTYTVRKASEGLAQFVIDQGEQAKQSGVVIAYDSRYKSREFAFEAAQVLGKHGIHVYVFDQLSPTPLLSFAVRHLGTFAGIVITASHNPPEYNGFKVYGPDGGQITLATAEALMTNIDRIDDELKIEVEDEQALKKSGLLCMIGSELLAEYLQHVKSIRIDSEIPTSKDQQIRIVFTPLHGTTLLPITLGLKEFGYHHVTVVKEQATPDPEFSTVTSPNPEEPQAFQFAIKYGMETNADLIIGTDPDGDRLGAAVKHPQGGFELLTGNQIGALLLHFLLSQKQNKGILPKNGVLLKTIVTSDLGRAIAADFGLETVDTLTGFKYIGEKIGEFEKTGEYSFQFGYEESYGFLIGDFVRDKDAVQTALLLADACSYYKSHGLHPYEALHQLFSKYGYYREGLHSVTYKGREGMKKISDILAQLRSCSREFIAGKKVKDVEDYLLGESKDMMTGETTLLTLPKTDAIKVQLEESSWFCVRPSGTEPKIKLYFGVRGSSLVHAQNALEHLKQSLIAEILSM